MGSLFARWNMISRIQNYLENKSLTYVVDGQYHSKQLTHVHPGRCFQPFQLVTTGSWTVPPARVELMSSSVRVKGSRFSISTAGSTAGVGPVESTVRKSRNTSYQDKYTHSSIVPRPCKWKLWSTAGMARVTNIVKTTG